MVIIDVRSKAEYAAGHHPEAVHVPHELFYAGGLPEPLRQTDKGERIIVYCRSGRRSGLVKQRLEAHGFSSVTNGINQQNVAALLG